MSPRLLQSWLGQVEEVHPTYLRVRLVDQTNPEVPEAFADLKRESVRREDQEHAVEGARFEWRVFEQDEAGARSEVVFLPMEHWSAQRLAQTQAEAEQLHAELQARLQNHKNND